jgi:Nucleotide modification associated domain 2
MQVAEKITFADYWGDPRFAKKIPDIRSKYLKRKRGDNIYEPLATGEYRQHPSGHSKGFTENDELKQIDLSGEFALVATDFVYFGQSTLAVPPRFTSIIPGRGHRSNFAPICLPA